MMIVVLINHPIPSPNCTLTQVLSAVFLLFMAFLRYWPFNL